MKSKTTTNQLSAIILICVLATVKVNGFAQNLLNNAVPDMGETSEYFCDWPAGKSPAEIGKKVSENFLSRGHYQEFDNVVYPEVCAWYGAFRIARQTGDNALAEQLVDRFDNYLKPQNAKLFPYQFHVDHCVNGVVPLEIYRITNDEQYLKLGMKRADYQWEKPTADGITRQARYWVDDIYMISAIQTEAYRVTGEMKYLDRAALTTSTYIKKLQQPDGLFFHAEDSPFCWGRGVGWFAAGMTEILRELPKDHPYYAPIMKGYLKMMAALLKHQSDSGLWRQLVDKPESWYETSSTGMYTYAIVTGVKRGWLDKKTYGPAARKAWLALVDNLDENYNVKNVCVGTNKAAKMVGTDLDTQYKYYLARPRCTGDYHGQAPILWIAAAMLAQPKSELVREVEGIFYKPGFINIPEKIFLAKSYGVKADGKTVNTKAIQAAIDAAHKADGGVVTLPKGIILSGALFVKSNVELRLDEGVVLQAVNDDSKFLDIKTRIAGVEMEWPAALINVYKQKNVSITGKGIIDGNGKYWWDKFWGDPPMSGGMYPEYVKQNLRWALDYDCKRVRPVVIYESENVLLKDFTVQRAGFWTISLTYCNKVHVDGLKIRNNIGGHGPSTDGIDVDSSKDILVENCNIDCNDDNLCIKSGKDADGLRVNRPAENIVIRNCITLAGHGLITLGSETSGGMRNIEVYGLEANGTSTGIRFKSAKVRGGVMEKIWFHDIKMTNVKSPFRVQLNWFPEYSYPTIPDEIPLDEIPERWKILTQPVLPPEMGIPEFKNITISDIDVTGAEQAFFANAYIEKPMRDITWKNISIEAKESGEINHALNWTMENVTLKILSGKNITLTNCVNIELPELF